CQQHNTYPYNF
nr:immunoglobulin light chain junction region [Macaca mulatta]MOW66061.1 immunoglobulin light chain junction region [Macaca mulatta]